VKPLNVLVSAHNVAKLSDVGLTKRLEATLTRPGGWTPAYAAPEILARSGANEKSDIFSFGLMVWQVRSAAHARSCWVRRGVPSVLPHSRDVSAPLPVCNRSTRGARRPRLSLAMWTRPGQSPQSYEVLTRNLAVTPALLL